MPQLNSELTLAVAAAAFSIHVVQNQLFIEIQRDDEHMYYIYGGKEMNFWETNAGFEAIQQLIGVLMDINNSLEEIREEIQNLKEDK